MPSSQTASGQDDPAETDRILSLLYCRSDSLNPFSCSTKYNRDLCSLLYDPLFKLNESYVPQLCLAQSFQVEAAFVSVQLKPAKFSDGSVLSADDVIFSYTLAKQTARYREALATSKISKTDDGGVEFALSESDGNFINFLDFPIIKAGSDALRDNDNRLLPPVGCGRYIYDRSAQTLHANSSYHNGTVRIADIRLIDTPDRVAADHQLEVGAVDCYYSDLADGDVPKLNGTGQTVILNKLVYIGINQNDARLRDVNARHAMSAALNRSDLLRTVYHGNAVAATGPFHPLWEPAKEYKYIEEKENSDIVLANLTESGYNEKDGSGVYRNAGGERFSFSMLCPDSDKERVEAAKQIQTQFAAVGMELQIEVLPFSEYSERLVSGNFQLYLAETLIPQNMDISYFTVPGGTMAYGVLSGETVEDPVSSGTASSVDDLKSAQFKTYAEAMAEYKALKASLFDVVSLFYAELPVIPICFKCGIGIFASDFLVSPYVTASDCFFGIEDASFRVR